MKLKRIIKANQLGLKVTIDITLDSNRDYYMSDEVKQKRKEMVNGIYDLLRSKLEFELEEITLK